MFTKNYTKMKKIILAKIPGYETFISPDFYMINEKEILSLLTCLLMLQIIHWQATLNISM